MELKPCPFCGGPAGTFVFVTTMSMERNAIQFTVKCKNCGVEKSRAVSFGKSCEFIDIERGVSKAIEAWNWRAEHVDTD